MDNKSTPKESWLRHVTHLKFCSPVHILGMAAVRAVKFCIQRVYIVLPKGL